MLTREQLQRAARDTGFPIDSLEKVSMLALDGPSRRSERMCGRWGEAEASAIRNICQKH